MDWPTGNMLSHLHPRVDPQAYSRIHLLLLKKLLFEELVCWHGLEAPAHSRPHEGTHCRLPDR